MGADVEVMKQGGRVQDFMPERTPQQDTKSASNRAEPSPYKSAYAQDKKRVVKKKRPSTAVASAQASPRRQKSPLGGRQVSPTRAQIEMEEATGIQAYVKSPV